MQSKKYGVRSPSCVGIDEAAGSADRYALRTTDYALLPVAHPHIRRYHARPRWGVAKW